MKFVAAILSLGVSSLLQGEQYGVTAFSFTKSMSSFRPATQSSSSNTLSMNVESNDGKKLIKVGVIGMGRIGLVHLEAITKAPGVVPIIVSNPTVSKAEAAAAQYNIPKFSDDAMDVITDPEVDAVWICSPSQFHADQIKACAANNKHVFCEKPIATDLAETVEAINACNEAGVKLMIGLQRRSDQNFERVKQAVEDNEVGTPIMVRKFSFLLCCIKFFIFFFFSLI
jgi:myo-inositol 2-dehydrogenase/D-chiro-inositol 1-dehydrogenase